jgi:hypothetical protein
MKFRHTPCNSSSISAIFTFWTRVLVPDIYMELTGLYSLTANIWIYKINSKGLCYASIGSGANCIYFKQKSLSRLYLIKLVPRLIRLIIFSLKFALCLKAMLHGAIFLATCNAILLLRDVKLPNTRLHCTPLMFSQHIENSSLISLINISQD